MKPNTDTLLKIMFFLAWLAMVGLMVKAGAILISYFVSISNDTAAKDLYKGMDLSIYKEYSFVHYSLIVGYKFLLSVGKAYIVYLITKLLDGINIVKPFNEKVVKLMEKLSISMMYVWAIALIHNIHLKILEEFVELNAPYVVSDFLIFSGIIYILAQLFKRGVEFQALNESTI